MTLAAGSDHEFTWTVPETKGAPIAEIGIELCSHHGANGTVYLDYLTWDATPNVVLKRPPHAGTIVILNQFHTP